MTKREQEELQQVSNQLSRCERKLAVLINQNADYARLIELLVDRYDISDDVLDQLRMASAAR